MNSRFDKFEDRRIRREDPGSGPSSVRPRVASLPGLAGMMESGKGTGLRSTVSSHATVPWQTAVNIVDILPGWASRISRSTPWSSMISGDEIPGDSRL